jgi:signal transduction histidine kinase
LAFFFVFLALVQKGYLTVFRLSFLLFAMPLRYYFIMIVSVLLPCLGFAQGQPRYAFEDSLFAVLQNTNLTIQDRLKTLRTLAYELHELQPKRTETIAQEGLQYARALGSTCDSAEFMRLIGISYRMRGDLSTALKYYFKANRLFLRCNDSGGQAATANNIGVIYQLQEDYVLALSEFIRALRIREIRKEERFIAQALDNIGSVLMEHNKFDSAAAYFARSLALKQRYRQSAIQFTQSNLGLALAYLGKHQAASDTLNHALNYAMKQKYMPGVAIASEYLGEALRLDNQAEKALPHLHTALTIYRFVQNMPRVASVLEELASAHTVSQRYDSAKIYGAAAIDESTKLRRFRVRASVAAMMQTIAEREKKPEIIAHFRTLVAQSNDSLLALIEENHRTHIDFIFALDNQRVENSQLKTELQSSQGNTTRIAWILGWIGLSLCGVSAFAYIAVRSRRRFQEENTALIAANAEIERQRSLLHEQAAELDAVNQEVLSSNVELIEKNTKLAEANTFKMEMLSVAAHDLKNPLGGILGLTDILRSNADIDESIKEEILTQIKHSTENMVKLISNVLDTSAIDLGKIHLRPYWFDATFTVRTLLQEYYFAADIKKQHILADLPEKILLYLDEQRLRQVMDNLLSNAIKYSPLGGTIEISLSTTTVEMREMLVFRVKDSGPGLSEEDKTKLFQHFQRLSARPTGGESSTGVGLAIVKQIVDIYEGSIHVASVLGEGVEFTVEIPVSNPPEHIDFTPAM